MTDDARLVLAVLQEAAVAGAAVLNHAAVTGPLRTRGQVRGVSVVDAVTGSDVEVMADVVVNATGAWADALRAEVGGPARMRPLRGSHLVVPGWRFPAPPSSTSATRGTVAPSASPPGWGRRWSGPPTWPTTATSTAWR